MPRAKIKVHEYDTNGKFVKTYQSHTEVREFHFSNDTGKRPLFILSHPEDDAIKYGMLPNGNYIFNEKLGREFVKRLNKIRNSTLIVNYAKADDKEVAMYNILGEKIAVFKNLTFASKLLKIKDSTLHSQLRKKHNALFGSNLDYYFEYI